LKRSLLTALLFTFSCGLGFAIQDFSHKAILGPYWDSADIPVTFYVDAAFPASWDAALQRGFSNWEAAPRTNFRYTVPGTLSGHSANFTSYSIDGINIVSPILSDNSNYDSSFAGALAITWTGVYNTSNYHYYETDIIFNTKDFTFSTGTGIPPFNQYDAEGILTHESGHAFGLLDIYNSDFSGWQEWMGDQNDAWTMYGITGTQDIQKRSPEPFDVQGETYLYPVQTSLQSKTPVVSTTVPWTWTFTPTQRYWTAIAVRAYAGSVLDKDIELYDADDRALASSVAGTGLVDLIMVDYNHAPLGGLAWPRVTYGTDESYIVELSQEGKTLQPSAPETVVLTDPESLVDCWDVFLQAGHAYRFTVTNPDGALDMGAALFRSSGAAYAAGRDQAVSLSDVSGTGGTEQVDFTCPTDDWYGFVAFNNGASPSGPTGSYVVDLQDLGATTPPAPGTSTPSFTPTFTHRPTPDLGSTLANAIDAPSLTVEPGGNVLPFV